MNLSLGDALRRARGDESEVVDEGSIVDASIPSSTEIRICQAVGEYLLSCFKELCDAEGIGYFLNGGSLLGAVRNGGWIPWDDDIDLMMLRTEYEAFRDRAHLLPVDVRLSDPELTVGHASIVPRLTYVPSTLEFVDRFGIRAPERQRVVADIFILDPVPAHQVCILPWWLSARMIQVLLGLKATTMAEIWRSPERFSARVAAEGAWLFSAALPRQRLAKLYVQIASRFGEHESGGLISLNSAGRHSRLVFPRRLFEGDACSVSFCGIDCPAPSPEEFLSALYGPDFMSPPPKSHRVPHRFTRLSADLPRGIASL